MAEYISREAAIAYIREQSEECQKAFEELGGESGIYCEHSYEAVGGRVCTYGVCVDCEVTEDFFCSYGKRKEE